MENKLWLRNAYEVKMFEIDFDLYGFEIVQFGEVIDEIVPDSVNAMNDIINNLNNGECVDGWDNGMGGTININ